MLQKAMSELKSQRQAGPREYAIIFAFVVLLTVIVYYATLFALTGLSFDVLLHSRPFDASIWRSDPKQRPYMVADLMIRKPLKGLKKSDIRNLLGQPDGPYLEDYMILPQDYGWTHLLLFYDSEDHVTDMVVMLAGPS